MFEAIKRNIQKCAAFAESEFALFCESLEIVRLPKKQFWLRPGEICNFEAYVNQGCLRTYCIDKEGKEVTLNFAIEDWWVGDLASFNEQAPSQLYIETLEITELLQLSFSAKERLLEEIPRLERVFRIMVQRHLTATQNRLIQTIVQSAEIRYLDFLKRYAPLARRIPQHYIAYYLGISPEFLSKIRTKLMKQDDFR